jgi:ABC-type nitrate/sulfonate/bicarbonate transport system permease component
MGKRERGLNDVLVVLVLVIAAWETLGRMFHLRPDFVPTPSRIVLEAWRENAQLIENAVASGLALATGILAVLAFSLALALLCGSGARHCSIVERVLTAAQGIPFIAAVPVLVVWFGYRKTPEVLVVFAVAFPVVGGAVLRRLRTIPPEILDFARALHASPLDVAVKIQLPWVLPSLLGSLEKAISMSVAAATAAEFVLAESGLGAVMIGAVSNLNTPLLMAAFLCVTALAVVPIGVLELAERVLAPQPADEAGLSLLQLR